MFVENFTKFIRYYGKGRKIKLFCFLILSVVVALTELAGVALIYPFILLIVKPQMVIHTKYYSDFAAFTHIQVPMTNAFILGALVTLLFVVKNLFVIGSLYLQSKFVNNWKLDINKKFMKYYLCSPYKEQLKTAPSEKLYFLNFLTAQTLDGFVLRIIGMITNIAIVAMILLFLFTKFLFAAFLTCLFVFFSLSFQNKVFKKKMLELSKRFLDVSGENNQKSVDSVTNIKEIKILSAEKYFYDEYSRAQKNYTQSVFESTFYSAIPPYIIESLAIVSLFILAGIISLQNMENVSWMIASYAIVVASIFRVAPALNRIQSAVNSINVSRDLVKTMIAEYENNNLDVTEEEAGEKVVFENSISLKDINFAYKKDSVIKNLSLEIKKGEFIGIIGLSGAGKSTLADIIMGLLPVDSGEIFVDDIKFNQKNYSSLRKLISYVPQQINIIDDSFKRNVALGLNDDEIDDEKVVDALKRAQLYDFVNSFEEGINSKVIVGSMGISQGQKQRLAIARAFYRNSEILIFDEATSSLDVETEHEITKMLNSLKGEKTIIAIAHRLSTLKSCDRLIYLKYGKLVDSGTFSELSARHADFEKLIRLSKLDVI